MTEIESFAAGRDGDDLFLYPQDHQQHVTRMAARIRVILTRPGEEVDKALWELFDDKEYTPEYRWKLVQEAFPLVMAFELEEADRFEVTLLSGHIAQFVQFARRRLKA